VLLRGGIQSRAPLPSRAAVGGWHTHTYLTCCLTCLTKPLLTRREDASCARTHARTHARAHTHTQVLCFGDAAKDDSAGGGVEVVDPPEEGSSSSWLWSPQDEGASSSSSEVAGGEFSRKRRHDGTSAGGAPGVANSRVTNPCVTIARFHCTWRQPGGGAAGGVVDGGGGGGWATPRPWFGRYVNRSCSLVAS